MTRRKRVNVKGRRDGSGRFVALDHSLLDSEAYRSLSCGARSLLVEFAKLYNGANNGELFMSQRTAAAKLGISSHTAAARYIDQLIDRGFISIRIKGSFNVKTGRATSYVLAQYRMGDQPPSRAFKKWTPPAKKSRGRKGAAAGQKREPVELKEWPAGDIG